MEVQSASVPVGVAAAAKQDIPIFIESIGTVQAYNTVAIHPQVDGQLVKVQFKEGQIVRMGDVLAQIDARSYRAALDQALAKKSQDEAQLGNAKLDVQRYASLVQNNYIARQQLDATQAQVRQLEAAVKGDEAAIDAARIQWEFTTIRSPITGRAGIRQIDVGNIVHGGGVGSSGGPPETLTVITQMHPIDVVFTIGQKDLARLLPAAGQATLSVAAFSKDDGSLLDAGRLEVIDNQIDGATGTLRLKAVMPNAKGRLWPGQYVYVKLRLNTHAGSITVPSSAVQAGVRGPFVYVVRADSTVEMRDVVTGAVTEDSAEIVRGVAAGETVVTSGHYRLRPGIKVLVHTKTAGKS